MTTRQRIALLALALVIASALRGGRLWWGLDDATWFHDEGLWALRLDARTPPEVIQGPAVGLVYPTAYEYAAEFLYRLGGRAADAASDGTTVLRAYASGGGDTPFLDAIRAARLTSALASLVGVLAVAAAGWRLFGADVGVVAALMLATSPFEVLQVHCASVDPLLAALGTLTILASWRLVQVPTATSALVAGLAAGAGFATKYTGAAFVVPIAWAVAETIGRRGAAAAAMVAGVAAASLAASFATSCPRCVLHPADVAGMLSWHSSLASAAPFDGNRLAESVGWYARPWMYQLVAAFPYLLGLPTYLLALAGVVYACTQRTLGDRLILALLVPFFAVVGAADSTFPRQLLPMVPGLVLLAARAGLRLPDRRVRIALVVSVVVYSLALSVTHVRRLSWDQQRAVATFIAESANAQQATPVVVAFPQYGPYLRLDRPLEDAGLRPQGRGSRRWFTDPAPFFVMPHWYATAIRRDRREPAMLADLAALESGRAGYRRVLDLPVPWYLQRRLDAWLDSALAVDLWQGTIGFSTYVREEPR